MLPDPLPFLDTGLFARDYADARSRFLAAGDYLLATTERRTYTHPLQGPAGEKLALDALWIGEPDAERVLITTSACHGVEGFAGSAIQTDSLHWLGDGHLPGNLAVLHIHALNPWGFAWLRRTDQQGIDNNRNFIDFSALAPANPGYEELADALVPTALDPEILAKAQAQLEDYRQRHGQTALEIAVSGGQYSHPKGLFYGGTQPSWTHRTLLELYADFALHRRGWIGVIDLHTGLGPYGYGEMICDHPPQSAGVKLARRWYGATVTEPVLGTSSSVQKSGLHDYFWHARLSERGCFVTLEFGTYTFDDLFGVLRADHWLHSQAALDTGSERYQEIKQRMRQHFYPEHDDWRQMVLFRGRQALAQGLRGLCDV